MSSDATEADLRAQIAALEARVAELEADSEGRRAWAPKLAFTAAELEKLLAEVSDYLWSAEAKPDGSFEYRYVSPVVQAITGRPPSFHIGGGWLSTLHPDDVAHIQGELGRLLSGERDAVEVEYRIVMPDGSIRWLHDRVVAHPRAGGGKILNGVVRDVTERTLAEQRARQLEGEIRHAERIESLAVLAGGIAHDFNNQLLTVLGSVDLARMKLELDRDPGPELGQAEAAATRCAELCRQLLAFSGKGQFAVEPFDLAEVVDAALALVGSPERRPTIRREFEGGLPALTGDAIQMRQVVKNLVLNACEAVEAKPGGGVVEVRVARVEVDAVELADVQAGAPLEPGSYLALEVADEGCGMDPATLERIFDPFYTTKLTGRGLGLAAVQGIVRGHRGGIWVESEPGQGTRFRLLFPPSPESESEADAEA